MLFVLIVVNYGFMSLSISINNLSYSVASGRKLLSNLNLKVPEGAFVALLGENGAGKSTLMELLMGFRIPTSGEVIVADTSPSNDSWQQREHISYLSEKMGIPGDWTVKQFLDFNRFFYPNYSMDLEKELSQLFRLDPSASLFNLSAGEIRRVQVVGALSIKPKLVLVDEITAVLDIVGRKIFLDFLSQLRKKSGTTVVLATNILEDLPRHISHIALICQGEMRNFETIDQFLDKHQPEAFSSLVAERLTTV